MLRFIGNVFVEFVALVLAPVLMLAFFYHARRALRGARTPMWYRRALAVSAKHADFLPLIEHTFGPHMRQRIMDHERRRRMVLFHLGAIQGQP